MRLIGVVTLLLLFPGLGWSATLEVGAGRTYSTINQGISGASSGDTILVHDGIYNENVTCGSKGSLHIISNNLHGAVIDPPDSSSSGAVELSSGTTFEGFQVTDWGGDYGIYTNNKNNVKILNNKIHHFSHYGIYARNGENILISGNAIHDGQKGIFIVSGGSTDGTYEKGIRIINNDVYNCYHDGIDLGSGEYWTIADNNIYDNINENYLNTHPDAIQFIGGDIDGWDVFEHVQIYNNTIKNSHQNLFISTLGEVYGYDIHIFNNVIYNDSGIVNGVNMDSEPFSNVVIQKGKNVYIYNNTIGRAGNLGIYFLNNADHSIFIKNNIIHNSLNNGIWFTDKDDMAPGGVQNNIFYTKDSPIRIESSWYNSASSFQSAYPEYAENNFDEDPLTGMFPLVYPKEDSPAIDNGLNLGDLYSVDKTGKIRPSGYWDIGAIEFSPDFDSVSPEKPASLQKITF